jgi:hypothetical protein
MNDTMRTLDAVELDDVAGGYDDYCGTPWRRLPIWVITNPEPTPWTPIGGVVLGP